MNTTLSLEETHQYYRDNRSARRSVLLTICLGSMLGPFALAAVNLALPTIAVDLNANAVLVSWMPTGFLLSSVMFMLPAGKLADRYGRKRFYFCGVLFTGLFSVLASFGQSMEWLLMCRLFQGVSMAMVFGSGMAIITSIHPASERGAAIGMNAASVYIALTLAPVFGGWITEVLGWRSVFLMQVPPVTVVVLMLLFIKGEWRDPVNKPFDWTGSLIFALWAGSLVYGLSGLPKTSSIVTLILSFAYLWLFVFHQNRAEHPLIRPRILLANKLFSFSLLSAMFIYGASYPLGFLLSLFLQLALGYSPIEAGKVLLLQAMIMAFVAPIAGRLSDRFDPGRISTLGCLLMMFGFIQMSFVSGSADSARTITMGYVLTGMGFGLFTTPNINAAMSTIAKAELGVASATINLARTIGNMLGISLVSLLIYNLIGANEFTSDQTEELITTVRIWVYLAIGFAIAAAVFSFSRGKIKRAANPKKVEELTGGDDLTT